MLGDVILLEGSSDPIHCVFFSFFENIIYILLCLGIVPSREPLPTGAAILMCGATPVAHRTTRQEVDSSGLRLARSEMTRRRRRIEDDWGSASVQRGDDCSHQRLAAFIGADENHQPRLALNYFSRSLKITLIASVQKNEWVDVKHTVWLEIKHLVTKPKLWFSNILSFFLTLNHPFILFSVILHEYIIKMWKNINSIKY